jgi:hypothetical protein
VSGGVIGKRCANRRSAERSEANYSQSTPKENNKCFRAARIPPAGGAGCQIVVLLDLCAGDVSIKSRAVLRLEVGFTNKKERKK